MKNKDVLKYFENRGLVAQTIFYDELKKELETKVVNFYIGFDPTADSLHIGHFVLLQIAKHLQIAGHKPFFILGDGTGLVGDPSGRSDMRKMLTSEQIKLNVLKMQKQMERFVKFNGKNSAKFLFNSEWLLKLKWVEILREVGVNISVNKMLATDAYKTRWEKGLSFLELNYMVMQAYDFLYLNRNENVTLQIGGNDQWSNIIAGVDLIRRLEKKTTFGLTATLLTKADGTKMGKTSNGALWLDSKKTSVYDFFQYWININDEDVKNCFLMLTDLEKDEIEKITIKKGSAMIDAKRKLAYIITSMVHGKKEAEIAQKQTLAAFSNDISNMPEIKIKWPINNDKSAVSLIVESKIASSKSEARRLIADGGITFDEIKIKNISENVNSEIIKNKKVVIHKGKKKHILVKLV